MWASVPTEVTNLTLAAPSCAEIRRRDGNCETYFFDALLSELRVSKKSMIVA